jgi:hypothetical protein
VGFGHRYRLWVVLGLCGTYVGVLERFYMFLRVLAGTPTVAIFGCFCGRWHAKCMLGAYKLWGGCGWGGGVVAPSR